MRRKLGPGDKLYRAKAIIKVPTAVSRYGHPVESSKPRIFNVEVGPYSSAGAAKGSLTQEIRERTRYLDYGYKLEGEIEIERWVEQAETTWIRLP